MSDASFFPLNYANSRERFRAAVSEFGGNPQVGEWAIPSQIDSDLFVDHAYWPALRSPEVLIVATSGIHGSETYAGAAIQMMMIKEILPNANRDRVGFLLVHAMNPFGFKHHQRNTESGVNLNRNFAVGEDIFGMRNELSAQMHERFFSRRPVDSLTSVLMQKMKMREGTIYFDDVSLDQFTKAVLPGQWEYRENLEFGGFQLEEQSQKLIDKVGEIMPAYRDIIGLDLHTGLGDKNRLHLLGGSLNPQLFSQLFHVAEDRDIYSHTPSATSGFYTVYGAVKNVFTALANTHQRVCALTMEYGTLGHSLDAQMAGFNSMILALQGKCYGFIDSNLEEKIKQMCFLRSYPQNDEWRNSVVGAARLLCERILERC